MGKYTVFCMLVFSDDFFWNAGAGLSSGHLGMTARHLGLRGYTKYDNCCADAPVA